MHLLPGTLPLTEQGDAEKTRALQPLPAPITPAQPQDAKLPLDALPVPPTDHDKQVNILRSPQMGQ